MDKVNLPFFYKLGTQLNPLSEITDVSNKRVDILLAALEAKESVNLLLNWTGGLNVCRASASAFISSTDAIINWYKTATPEEKSKDDYLIDGKFRLVVEKAKTFQTVLTEELGTLSAYSVSKKGAYSMSDLIDKAENIFPYSVQSKFNKDIVREIQEAGKCFVFDIPTACGFHMLRAMEEVMYEYYLVVCKPEDKSKLESWGAYISCLRKFTEDESKNGREVKKHVKKVLGLLQQIKDQDRNLIMHPEVVLSADEAFILFEISKGSIMTMAELMPTNKAILEK